MDCGDWAMMKSNRETVKMMYEAENNTLGINSKYGFNAIYAINREIA